MTHPANDLAADSRRSDELSLSVLARSVRRNRRALIVITAGFIFFGAIVAWLQLPMYRATLVFALVQPPFSDQPSGLGDTSALSTIGKIAGINLSGSGPDLAINLEVLKSTNLAGEFLESRGLIKEIASNRASWRFMPDPSVDVPPRRIVEYFRHNVRAIKPTTTTGVYQLEIQWKSGEASAHWANEFIEFANEKLRADAVARGEKRLAFLRERVQGESVTQVRESLGWLIGEELKRLALTTDVDAYAFRVIDPAVVPLTRAKPRRLLILFLAAVSGAILATAFVLARDSMRGLLHA